MGPSSPSADITVLLQQWKSGDAGAFDRVSAIVYPELRRIALGYLRRERAGHTLQPTALVNEVFLRFTASGLLDIRGRRHFYALAAQLMRQILVDHARAIRAQKRGGDLQKVPLEDVIGSSADFAGQFLLLHQALDELKELNPRKAELIELRYFGGMTLEESAEHLGLTRSTAYREERLALAWLNQRIAE